MNKHPETYLKIHLAGIYTGSIRGGNIWPTASVSDFDRNKILDYPYMLESYHYLGKSKKNCGLIRQDNRKIFLDSGAFSMFTQGVEVPLEKYAQFVKDNQDIIEVASVLDGIGDPEKTLVNQKKLEDLDIEVLPCFHYGEPFSYLEYYLENYPHITLGGMVPISTPNLRIWLDNLWENYLTDKDGYPTHRVHGFGLTVVDLMYRYPWYSVDSTTWVLTARFGNIMWMLENGKDTKLNISDKSSSLKKFDAHFVTLPEYDQKRIIEKVESKGYTIESLAAIYWKRDLWNIDFMRDMCDLPMKPFHNQEQGLF